MEKKIKFWVKIVGILIIIYGLCAIGDILFQSPALNFPSLVINVIPLSIFMLLGIFILNLKNWARIVFIIYTIVFLILCLLLSTITFECLRPGVTREPSTLVSLIYYLILCALPGVGAIYFLTRPRVKEQFK